MKLATPDLLVIACYLASVVGCGCWFIRRNRDSERFISADRSLPGWAVGLSIFGSYISSISFLANPGKSFAGNWNPLVFSLTTPLAALVAVRWFVPFYRKSGAISAYEHFERRFGAWARGYAVGCYLLVQLARTGTIMYLLALALAPLTGWDLRVIIVVTGTLMTLYTLAGGLEAVVWTGVIQSGVLIAAALTCVVWLVASVPGGTGEIVRVGLEHGKFELGSFGPDLTQATVWVVLIYGLTTHLQNFGIDQSYVQRYVTARSDREAAGSIWLGSLLYVPIAAVFFFIGTALFAFYQAFPERLVGSAEADAVFPYFIATELPVGVKGLVITGIIAAAMDSSLNSLATLFLCDIYQRYFRPRPGRRESLGVLYAATTIFGLSSIAVALAMIRARTVLDVWWEMAGVLSGGMLGLFLLGLLVRRAGSVAAASGVAAGLVVIGWMSLSPRWPAAAGQFAYRGHSFLIIVAGTITILLVGMVVSRICPSGHEEPPVESPLEPPS